MKFLVLTVSHVRSQSNGLSGGIQDYCQKINPMVKCEVQVLKGKRLEREQSQAKQSLDSKQILSEIQPDDLVVVLDEGGIQLTSIEFSKYLQRFLGSSKKRVVWVVGGAYGTSEALKARANYKLSLSKLTFNHHLALSVLMEQIYRGMTILKNIPYHNE